MYDKALRSAPRYDTAVSCGSSTTRLAERLEPSFTAGGGTITTDSLKANYATLARF